MTSPVGKGVPASPTSDLGDISQKSNPKKRKFDTCDSASSSSSSFLPSSSSSPPPPSPPSIQNSSSRDITKQQQKDWIRQTLHLGQQIASSNPFAPVLLRTAQELSEGRKIDLMKKEAESYALQGDIEKAIERYREIVAKNTLNIPLNLRLAELLSLRPDTEKEALSLFSYIGVNVKTDSSLRLRAYMLKGNLLRTYEGIGNLQEALKAYQLGIGILTTELGIHAFSDRNFQILNLKAGNTLMEMDKLDPSTIGELDPFTIGELDPSTIGELDPSTIGELDPSTMGTKDKNFAQALEYYSASFSHLPQERELAMKLLVNKYKENLWLRC